MTAPHHRWFSPTRVFRFCGFNVKVVPESVTDFNGGASVHYSTDDYFAPTRHMSRLANAPLQEVIFEVGWALDLDPSSGIESDTRFGLALGALKTLVKDKFPHHVARVPFYELAPHAFNRKAVMQFRKEPNGRPLLQLGPGVFTVNDTDKDYDWDDSFKPTLIYGLDKLEEAYDGTLLYDQVVLRYIDSVRVRDYGFTDWGSFIAEHLHFSYQNGFAKDLVPTDVSFQQLFECKNGDQLQIQVGSGSDSEGEPRLIWQTILQRKQAFDKAGLLAWGEEAHAYSSVIFKQFCKPDFYASFHKIRDTDIGPG
jgi:uncharacterized protein (TIGR04255 family)